MRDRARTLQSHNSSRRRVGRRLTATIACARLLIVAPIVACGGTAVIDVGSGGSSGLTTTSGHSTTNATTASGEASTTTSASGDLCEQACALFKSCLVIRDCVSQCQTASSACALEQSAFLSCVIEHYSGLCYTPDCFNALYDYLRCRGTGFPGGSCGLLSNGKCSCTAHDQAMNTMEAHCEVLGSGEGSCLCSFNGQAIGYCPSPTDPQCDAPYECCAFVLNVPGYP